MVNEARFSELSQKVATIAENQDESNRKMESMAKNFEELKEAIAGLVARLPATATPIRSPEIGNHSNSSEKATIEPDHPDLVGPGQAMMNRGVALTSQGGSIFPGGLAARLAKIEFPKFNRNNVKAWLYKCDQFFALDNTMPELKVRLASLHLEDKALQWHHNYLRSKQGEFPHWVDYVVDITARFGDLYEDPLAELVNLKQIDDVDDYLEKFEEALTRLHLSKAHALSIFLANMNKHLQLHVRQFNPTTISEAARLAKLYESSLAAYPSNPSNTDSSYYTNQNKFLSAGSKNFNPTKAPILPSPEPHKFPQPKTLALPAPFKPNSPISPRQFRKYTVEEMQERKSKGLCMYCDEKYVPGHELKHRRAQIFMLEGGELGVTEIQVKELLNDQSMEHDEKGMMYQLSANAMNGNVDYNCMRIHGSYNGKQISILIDPGSSHNFVDLEIAKALGCPLEPAPPLLVKAALGCELVSEYKCSDFRWKLQGMEFNTEVRTVPLECFDLILGIQWLVTISPVWWDYIDMRMKFMMNGRQCSLRGANNSECKIIRGSSLQKSCQQRAQLALLQTRKLTPEEEKLPLLHFSVVPFEKGKNQEKLTAPLADHIDKIGPAANTFVLPATFSIPNIFTVRQLKTCPNHLNETAILPQLMTDVGKRQRPKGDPGVQTCKGRKCYCNEGFGQLEGGSNGEGNLEVLCQLNRQISRT